MLPRCLFAVAVLLCTLPANGQTENGPKSIVPLGGSKFEGWKGLSVNGEAAAIKAPGEAVFRYPEGSKGWYVVGFRTGHDGTRDWRSYYGVQLEVQAPAGRGCELRAKLTTPAKLPRAEFIPETSAIAALTGTTGWQRVTIPFSAFDFSKAQSAFLEFVQELHLSANFADAKPGEIRIRNVRLVRAPVVGLDTEVHGRAVQAGETALYEVVLSNCTNVPQNVSLSFDKYGFEAMQASVEPVQMQIAPSATAKCVVTVAVPKQGIPPGGHESQKLRAISNGDGTTLAELELVTARDVLRPSILHTPEGWEGVRENVRRYDWAKQAQEELVKRADAWNVPEAATGEQRSHGPEGHVYVFLNKEFGGLQDAAYAWQLTRDKKYAEKAALFLRRLADVKTGYPSTFAGTSMGSPQEGGNFQGIAIAYDAILDSGLLTDADKQAIEHTFRLFMETYETDLTAGNMGNWSVAAATAGAFCALAMGDLATADRYLHGPAGFEDYLSKGVMDDGWWWECSTSYNFWVASELTQFALAYKPWGIDLLHHEVPASYSPFAIITPWGLKPPYGMSFEKWGPCVRNTRSVKQLWDAVPITADYRAVAFGMNDGHEELVGGSRMELAYYAFRDPAYVPLLRHAEKRDLIYGVPELPEETTKPYVQSGYAENLGFALLRSQTPNREPREQIQAVFKIGTQGGYHGHFDRVSLNTLMRYGRSFWDPETIWYGYGNFMYKFYVQTSVAHNMVVVDQMQQEAVPSSQLLFHSGTMMQVVAQETNARWSDPPYGGMVYDAFSSGGAVDGLRSLMKRNCQSFPLVTDRQWGDLGPYSDRVLQRRLGIVTDDYVVVADYVKSEKPHTFDNLFQMKTFLGLEAEGKKHLRHDAQFNPDPRSAAQFVTDCDWYSAAAPAMSRFQFDFGKGVANPGTQHNEDGTLMVDVHTLWPQQQEIMLATPPELPETRHWVDYEVTADGRSIAKGESGMWVLGAADIDVPVDGANELVLKVGIAEKSKKSALFLANPRIVTADGKEVPITDAVTAENALMPPQAGQDYYGGPIKIAGVPYPVAVPAQPKDEKQPVLIHIPVAGTNAARFKATLGGDSPLGDESQRRKIYAIRSKGTEARFLTVLEPYEKTAMVKSVTASGPDFLRVELTDGRVQEIAIQNLSGSGKDVAVKIRETAPGKELRTETAISKPE